MIERDEACAWQPIETAPKDRRILLAKIVGYPDRPAALWWATMGEWSARYERWWDRIEPSGLASPTHWMYVDAHGVTALGAAGETP